jgi:hypothetical protein
MRKGIPPDRQTGGVDTRGGTSMTKKAKTVRKAAFVFTKEEGGPGETETLQMAVVIPRRVGLWFRHYALDQGLSMAELIRRILREFMASHGGPAR